MPILERARLGLVGVRDDVFGTPGLVCHALPLDRGGERCTAASGETGGRSESITASATECDGLGQGCVAAVLAVRPQRCRVDDTDARQQAQPVLTELRRAERARLCDVDCIGGYRVGLAPTLHESSRRAFALAETRPTMDVLALRLEALRQFLRSGDVTRGVHAHVHGRLGVPRIVGAEQFVERRDAIGLGGRNLQHVAQVVQAAVD